MSKLLREVKGSRVLLGGVSALAIGLGSVHALDGQSGTSFESFSAGWSSFELVTSGDGIAGLSNSVYAPSNTFTRTQFDGMGVIPTPGNSGGLSVYLNHESIPASISKIDLSINQLKETVDNRLSGSFVPTSSPIVTSIGHAYSSIRSGSGSYLASGYSAVESYNNANYIRFCSATMHRANAFGANRGFADNIYLTGEERIGSGGKAVAVFPHLDELWEVEDFGIESWENFCQIDTGNTTHVAIVLLADNTNVGISGARFMLYVGRKGVDVDSNGTVDVLERNGLSGGTVYYYDPVVGVPDGDLPNGSESFTFTTVETDGEYEAKIEDGHTNPNNPTEIAFAAQLDGFYKMRFGLRFSSGGSLIIGSGGSTVVIDQLLQDANVHQTFDAPDNMTWAPDGSLYIQEDGGSFPSNEIWKTSASNPVGDLELVGKGVTETSGIIDISRELGYSDGTALLANVMGGVGLSQLSLLVNANVVPTRPILNLSTRGRVGTGDNVLIGGIIIGGSGTKKVLITGRGPSISSSVSGRLANPRIDIYNSSGAVIASNDDWINSPQQAAIGGTSIGPLMANEDAAVIMDLSPGAYTAIVRGVGGTEGVGIVEFYDQELGSTAKLLNLSTRGQVGTGDDVLIAGYIIGGSSFTTPTSAAKPLVIRGRGPSIPNSVPNRLSDPVISLYSGSTLSSQVDDWANDTASNGALHSGGSLEHFQPGSPFDAAAFRHFNGGGFTSILSGGTGIGIVEVFAAD